MVDTADRLCTCILPELLSIIMSPQLIGSDIWATGEHLADVEISRHLPAHYAERINRKGHTPSNCAYRERSTKNYRAGA